MKRLPTTVAMMLFVIITATSERSQVLGVEFTFGVYQTDTASQIYKKFKPVIDELESQLQSADDDVHVKMKIFKSYSAAREALLKREIDFARVGAASYILVKKADPDVRLLAMEEKKGKTHFDGMIAVPKDSKLTDLSDLKAQRFAFGDPSSTITFLAKAELVQAGIHVTDLTKIGYVGRHDLVAKRVSLRDFDAGSLKESTFKKSGDKLRVLKRIQIVTKPWVARSELADADFAAIRKALLAIDTPEALQALKVTSFVEASDEAYEVIRESMQHAAEF